MLNKKENIKVDDHLKGIISSRTAHKEPAIFYLANGVKFKGEISDATEITIEGNANAKINTNKLIVGNTGRLRGKISANTIEVNGMIKGTIKVSETLIIYEQGSVSGKIEYCNLEIKQGGNIVGDVQSVDKIRKIY